MENNIFWQRRNELVENWYESLSPVQDFGVRSLRFHLTTLTEKIIALLFADIPDPEEVQQIGNALAELTSYQPDALRKTVNVLGGFFFQVGTPPQFADFSPRFFDLLGQLAASCSAREKEQAKQATEMAKIQTKFINHISRELSSEQTELREASRALQNELQQRGQQELLIYAQKVDDFRQKMTLHIQDLLLFDRDEKTQITLSPEVFNIAEMINEFAKKTCWTIWQNETMSFTANTTLSLAQCLLTRCAFGRFF
jgi:signal transduction histidine kinase